jgi:hypothetical protein
MMEKGFSLNEIYADIELLNALRSAGYTTLSNFGVEPTDIWLDGYNTTTEREELKDEEADFQKVQTFWDMMIKSSAVGVAQKIIIENLEEKKPTAKVTPIPSYQEVVDSVITEQSGLNNSLVPWIRAIEYISELQSPHFAYMVNSTAHVQVLSDENGDLFRGFSTDENGNRRETFEEEDNDARLDVQNYLPQHKYAMKTAIATVDVILRSDPDAIIILQADHGIHGFGYEKAGKGYYNLEDLEKQGYTLEDALNLNLDVLSAVHIPEKYGGNPDKPLDPLNIVRYLVNHYVGKNYDYLPQKNGGKY